MDTKVAEPIADVTDRIRNIRARLPGQVLRERIDTARASYGPLYTLVEIRQKVAETIPLRFGFVRNTLLSSRSSGSRPRPTRRSGRSIPGSWPRSRVRSSTRSSRSGTSPDDARPSVARSAVTRGFRGTTIAPDGRTAILVQPRPTQATRPEAARHGR